MADEADIANDFMTNELLNALSRMRQNSAVVKSGPKMCPECGDEIPMARRHLGVKLCVPCAEEVERRNALFAD